MTIAIIPARGGSKRIPRKNIRLFHGKPLLSLAIEIAKASGCFDKVLVSTEDEEIAQVAQDSGAYVPFIRPAALADDFQGTTPVVVHALKWLQEHDCLPEIVCCLYATCPLLFPEDLAQAQQQLMDNPNLHYVFSGTRFSYPIQRALVYSHTKGVQPAFPEFIEQRSQDLAPRFHDAGQFYWGRSQSFLKDVAIFGPHSSLFELPVHRVCDIDREEDWQHAQLLYQILHA